MWKTTPSLAGLVEMQTMAGDYVEQVIEAECPERVGLEVIGGDQVLLFAQRREESAVIGS